MLISNNSLKQRAQDLMIKTQKNNLKIVTAESCTGGLISSFLTEIPGSSEVFDRGFITYSNQAKIENLGVRKETIKKFGAVSTETAKEMALGSIKNSQDNLSIAVTGIAGPNSDNSKKPVGLVFIASFNSQTKNLICQKFNFSGNRSEIRAQSIESALKILQDNQ